MSDSDDTDILLLIPPNFFLTETKLNASPNYEMFRSNLDQRTMKSTGSPRNFDKSANQSTNILLSHSKDAPLIPSQHKYRPYEEATPLTNMSHFRRSFERLNYDDTDKVRSNRRPNSPTTKLNQSHIGREYLGDHIGNLSSQKMSEWKVNSEETQRQRHQNQDDRVCSTNVWNNNLEFQSLTTHSTELEEERLRRRQCERNITLLQSQLNQYQNKFTDVIKIDQAKNDTLAKLHNTNSRLAPIYAVYVKVLDK